MSSTNLTLTIQNLVQQAAETLGETLQQEEMEIHDLEQKSKGANGRVYVHYQEKLKELHHTCEMLEAEPTGQRAEEITGLLTPIGTIPRGPP